MKPASLRAALLLLLVLAAAVGADSSSSSSRKDRANKRANLRGSGAGAGAGAAEWWDLTSTSTTSAMAMNSGAGTKITSNDMKDMIQWMKDSMDGLKKDDIRSGKTTILSVLNEMMERKLNSNSGSIEDQR